MKLGRLAARHDSRTLRLASFLQAPAHPPKVRWVPTTVKWGPMLNDRIGDCTIATAGHMIQAQTGLEYGGAGAVVKDSAILNAYKAVSGYDGTDATDNGAVVLDVLNYWRHTGIGGHKIWAFAAVNPKNVDEVKYATYAFGGVYLGVSLPTSWQGFVPWTVPATAPGSWGGHAIPALAYDTDGVTVVTWGKEIKMSWSAFPDYVDEAWVVLGSDWTNGHKPAPNGLNLPALQAALKHL